MAYINDASLSFIIIISVVPGFCIFVRLCKVMGGGKFTPRVIPLDSITTNSSPLECTSDPTAPPSYARFGQDTRLNPESTIVNIPPEVPGNTGTVAYPLMAANSISSGTGLAPEPYSTMEFSHQLPLYVPPSISPIGSRTSIYSQHSSTNTTPQSAPHLSTTTALPSSAVETELTEQEQLDTAPPPTYLEVTSENTAQATTTQPR
ncbi:hypothetical protein BGZ50_008327 [Haplosporangium sp. Z 11]|nr:hypothetical protein BGZ50_008327 [Haplosporangium sp. Z 11]